MEFVNAEFTPLRSKVLAIARLTPVLGAVPVREIIKNLIAENGRVYLFLAWMRHLRGMEEVFPYEGKVRATQPVMGQNNVLRDVDVPKRKLENYWGFPLLVWRDGRWRKHLTMLERRRFSYGSLHPNRVENDDVIVVQ